MFRSSFKALNATRGAVSRSFATSRGTKGVGAFALTGAGAAVISAAYITASNTTYAVCDPNYAALKKELIAMIDAEQERREDGTSIAGTLVRLAWHASGTYSAADKTGGSNGSTQRIEPEAGWGANAGLHTARNFLAPLKEKYNLSFADLWTFAGVVAVESMGGPKIAWRSGKKSNF